jgi:general secretion pathway protein B
VSYILEALRRAQGERSQTQPAPEITTEDGRPVLREPAPRQALLLAAAAGAATLAALLLLLWLLWPRAKPSADPQPAPVEPLEEAAAISGVIGGPQTFDDLAVSPGITDSADLPALEDEMALVDEPPLPETPDPVMENPVVQDSATVIAPSTSAPATKPMPQAEPQSEPQVDTVALAPPPPPTVRGLQDMPESYRSAFPRLRIEVHVYNDEPARRFVLVDGRQYREGDAVAQGPLIAEITPDGVIFSFRNEEVLIPAN